jgi:hypothetical protein
MDYNTVLLPEIGFLRPLSSSAGTGAVRDGSALEFQLEELVALGVLNVALDFSLMADHFCSTLPTALRSRVVIVNRDGECTRQFNALMAPVACEFEFDHHDHSAYFPGPGTPQGAVADIAQLMWGLYPLLLGIRHKTQVDLDMFTLRDAVERLRALSRSPDCRGTLSLVSGILATYQRTHVDSISIKSGASRELALAFTDFVSDETYRHLSQSAHQLGWPRRLSHAINDIGRHARELLNKRIFQNALDLTAQSFTAATCIPAPDSDFFSAFGSDGYLPPSVPIRQAVENARRRWLHAKPDIILPPELERLTREFDGKPENWPSRTRPPAANSGGKSGVTS